ncbi:MAG: winged helix DNA-binding domain-containing protein [Acidimicrobiia bacterium]|nr:winged helix DNA-binding domain-containing protein [Acidimicrobiia bacterium]
MTRLMTERDRRRRLVARHHLGRTARSVAEAVTALLAVHSSDPATPFLSMWARVAGFTGEDLERALYDERNLWRLHAMRRTLFVVPFEAAAMLGAAVGNANAAGVRRQLEQRLSMDIGTGNVAPWLAELEAAIMAVLADGGPCGTRELAAAVPGLSTEITAGSGKWVAQVPLSSRLPSIMAMERRIVRTRPAGTWRSSQYSWAAADAWFGQKPDVRDDPETARADLVARYLTAYGPATLTDVRWWTGWTAREARGALEDAGADTVVLSENAEGFVAQGDFESPSEGDESVALLPGLDSTPMGWKQRAWYLGDHVGPLFDRNGNVGPTVWVGGRVVGGWGQRADGAIVYRLLEDIGTEAGRRVEAEAEQLTAWLAGTIVNPRFQAPLERELSGQ